MPRNAMSSASRSQERNDRARLQLPSSARIARALRWRRPSPRALRDRSAQVTGAALAISLLEERTSMTPGIQKRLTTTYDAANRVIARINENGNATAYKFDAAGGRGSTLSFTHIS